MVDFVDNLPNQSDFIKNFFENMSEHLAKENQVIADSESENKKQRTQDLKITMAQFTNVNQFKDFRDPES